MLALSATSTCLDSKGPVDGGGPLVDAVLVDFVDIFTAPHGIPPQHGHEHAIHLLPGSPPVVVWPIGIRQRIRTSWNVSALQ